LRRTTEHASSHTKDGLNCALPIHLLGVAGVGKSTLVNTLLSDWLPLLPQGGVGSLTAHAVRIVHATDPYLALRRSPRKTIARLLGELTTPQPTRRAIQQARLLIQGSQFASGEPDHLIAELRAVERCERSPSRQPLIDIVSEDRCDWIVLRAGTHLPELREALATNVAGPLSPLLDEIELGWSSPVLAAGIQLVDLPGLGVANDIQQETARNELASALACLVVTDRSGITEVCAAALEAMPPSTRRIYAVTQLDQIARGRRIDEARGARRTWDEHFREIASEARRLIRGQLGREELDIHAVAPLEHRRFFHRDPGDPPAIQSLESAGIVELRDHLVALGTQWRASYHGHKVNAEG
jgi:hypothetical protein